MCDSGKVENSSGVDLYYLCAIKVRPQQQQQRNEILIIDNLLRSPSFQYGRHFDLGQPGLASSSIGYEEGGERT